MTDTIYALASGAGRAGVAVIRVSGDEAGECLRSLSGKPLPEPRRARLDRYQKSDKTYIDQGISLWFPAPGSFTGEDVAEFHIHGGPAVIEAMLGALEDQGARLAEPGEFSRRAFERGKMDLTEAEGLADLIDAETEAQRSQALAQMTGSLRALYEDWRESLLDILASVEGAIDFPDEDDVPAHLEARAAEPLDKLIDDLRHHLDDENQGERIREGFSIALLGVPNAGKSSLLNALARREAAIVTDIPGTTRDIVEIRLNLAGHVVHVSDTAGLRESDDRIEMEGIRRARQRAEDADLRLGIIDVSRETSEQIKHIPLRDGDAWVLNKTDLQEGVLPADGRPSFPISALDGSGVGKLETWVSDAVSSRLSGREGALITRQRHREAVTRAFQSLENARLSLLQSPELAGADIHQAVRALESLTGRIDIEDVLGKIFSQFCIGK